MIARRVRLGYRRSRGTRLAALLNDDQLLGMPRVQAARLRDWNSRMPILLSGAQFDLPGELRKHRDDLQLLPEEQRAAIEQLMLEYEIAITPLYQLRIRSAVETNVKELQLQTEWRFHDDGSPRTAEGEAAIAHEHANDRAHG
ncbi:MAG: hypothetical protein ACR2GY_14440 [Phycisphaerales bacterium]